jgi:hypothetical protein
MPRWLSRTRGAQRPTSSWSGPDALSGCSGLARSGSYWSRDARISGPVLFIISSSAAADQRQLHSGNRETMAGMMGSAGPGSGSAPSFQNRVGGG